MPLPEQYSPVDHCAAAKHNIVGKKAVKTISLAKKHKKKFRFKGSEVRYDRVTAFVPIRIPGVFAKPVVLREYSIPLSTYRSTRKQRGPPVLLS